MLYIGHDIKSRQTFNARLARSAKTKLTDNMIIIYLRYNPKSKPSQITKDLVLRKGAFFNFVKRNRYLLLIDRQLINGQIRTEYSLR